MFPVCYRSAMRDRPPINPFVPGRGVLPPFLAGRDSEQHELMRLLAYVQAGRGAPREAVLSGPRGNGKTVLLRWLEREIEAAGKVDVVWRTPSDLPSLDALATTLVPPARFRSLLPDTLSVSIGIGRLGWELGGNPGTLAELLTLRCAHRPLVILLDEAHTLDEGVGRALLNAGPVRGGRRALPAGAGGHSWPDPPPGPDVRDVLEPRQAHRCRSARRGRGPRRLWCDRSRSRTPPSPSRRRPCGACSTESQCYPYFLQLWGAALWDAATQQGGTLIDEAVVARASRAFDLERSTYYEHRRDELERQDLLQVAASVADAFAERATLAQDTLNAVIGGALALDSTPEIVQCRDRLAMVGLCLEAARRRRPVAAGHSEPDALRPSPMRAGRVCVQTGIASSHASPEPFDRESRLVFDTPEQIRNQLRAGEDGRAEFKEIC